MMNHPPRRRYVGVLALLLSWLAPVAPAQGLLEALQSPNPESDGDFGYSVAGVPDVDGDGFGDLLIGASSENGGAPDAGRAYLFSGASGALLHTLTSPNPETNGRFGAWANGVSDVDGDGFGDLLVGAPFEDGGAPDAGRAYLFSGASGALLHTLASPSPESPGRFGTGVAGVPDADGDGFGDLLVGAKFEDGGAADAGRAYLFSGASGALLHTLASPSPEAFGRFGTGVAGVPDADGDGFGDLLAGAPFEDGGATDAGRAYLFSGATGALLHTLASPNAAFDGRFGVSVSGVSDTDGGGFGDLLVGARSENGGAPDAGRAYLFSGASGALLHTLTSPNPNFAGNFGFDVSEVPDADGDGFGDLLVGAFTESGGAIDSGRAYVFSGATGTLLAGLVSPNPKFDGFFGFGVSGVPDANGDGRGDFLIGAYEETGGVFSAGRAYLFTGGDAPPRYELEVTPLSSLTVAPGGFVELSYTITNNTDEAAAGDLWAIAQRAPSGPRLTVGPIVSGTLGADEVVTGVYTQRIPEDAPAGTYTYVVNIGTFPGNPVDSDTLTVTATGTVTGSANAHTQGRPMGGAWRVTNVAGWGSAQLRHAVSAEAPSGATAYPNPFTGSTQVAFALEAPAHVRLAVFDVVGREVARLAEGQFAPGTHAMTFDGSELPSGVYLWRLDTGNAVQTGRLTLLR